MRRIIYRATVWDFSEIEWFFWGYLSCTLMALTGEIFDGRIGLSAIFWIVVIPIFFQFFFKVRKNLHYSYWTFAVTLLFYLLLSIKSLIGSENSFVFLSLYFIAIIFLCLEMYFLFSPIYYPLVRWWEYDFRFRDDFKIKVLVDKQNLEGRLTDLRWGAGCIALFRKYEKGTFIIVRLDDFPQMDAIKAEIVSRRQYSLGRPYTYGVRFALSSPINRKNYQNLVKYWKSRRRLLRKLKYSSGPS